MPIRDIAVFSDDNSYLDELLVTLPDAGRLQRLDWADVQNSLEENGAHVDKVAARFRNVLVFAAASRLPRLTSFLHAANRRHHLSALLVRDDQPEWIPQLLSRANVRALRNMLVHAHPETGVPRRVLSAWTMGAEDEFIADARTVDNHLLVVSCAMGQMELPFESIPVLRRMSEIDRRNFEIAEDGSYIHWPASEVDLDLDALRYVTDESYRRRADRERVTRDEQFGAAVAAVRRHHGLRQKDVEGISARQVRRIEKGKSASVSALKQLAAAHDMEVNDYLEEVAREMPV